LPKFRTKRPISGASNRMGQRSSGEERLKVGDHAVLHRNMRFDGVAADMRGQHDIRKRGQRIRRVRFLLEHVETGAAMVLSVRAETSAA